MRHRKAGVKLNRNSSHRKAMFRNMVTSLFKHDRIRTTDTKAKALRGWADHIVTLAKRGDLHARRQALSIIREKDVVHKIFEEAPKRFGTISGGYTRIVKLGHRPGDAAPVSLIELVSAEDRAKPKKKKKPAAKTQPAASAPAPADTAEEPSVEEEKAAAADLGEPEAAAESDAAVAADAPQESEPPAPEADDAVEADAAPADAAETDEAAPSAPEETKKDADSEPSPS